MYVFLCKLNNQRITVKARPQAISCFCLHLCYSPFVIATVSTYQPYLFYLFCSPDTSA